MLANKLKELRGKRRISQRELANVIGVSQQTVASWEVGRTAPSYDFLKQLANYFCVSVNYLLDEDTSNSAREVPPSLSDEALKLANGYDRLNNEGQSVLRSMLSSLIMTNARRDRVLQA